MDPGVTCAPVDSSGRQVVSVDIGNPPGLHVLLPVGGGITSRTVGAQKFIFRAKNDVRRR